MDAHLPEIHRRRDALMGGLADHEIRAKRASGVWRRLHSGTYVRVDQCDALDAEAKHRLLIRVMVPVLAESAVLSHDSAALIHGLPLFGLDLNRVHVTRNRTGGGRSTKSVVVHCSPLDDFVMVDGFRVTSLARTIVDIARTHPLDTAVVAGDVALKKGATASEIADEVVRARRRQGVAAARRVVQRLDGRSESVAESLSRVRLWQNGFDDVELQIEVRDAKGRLLGRTDFLVSSSVFGEFDGMVKYGKYLRPGQQPGDAVFEEKKREDAMRDCGYQMVRWTWADLFSFGDVADRIRAAIKRAEGSPAPTGTVRPASSL